LRIVNQAQRHWWRYEATLDHTIIHFEIPAEDVERLRKFYSHLFGWKIEKMPGPMDYWNIETVPIDEEGNRFGRA